MSAFYSIFFHDVKKTLKQRTILKATDIGIEKEEEGFQLGFNQVIIQTLNYSSYYINK